MDQEKIGKFIADLRKEKGMTQRQLADGIGVSDKAVSKWETGNGMPEIATVMPLCEMLQINVNELLAGERLSGDSYSQKAEENIMNLIQETENSKKQGKNQVISEMVRLVLSVLMVVVVVGAMTLTGIGIQNTVALLDVPSLTFLLAATALSLSVTGLWKSFFRAFALLFGKGERTAKAVEESRVAVKLVDNVILTTGILTAVTGVIGGCLFTAFDPSAGWSMFSLCLEVSLLGPLYAFILHLFLLPIRSRLELLLASL